MSLGPARSFWRAQTQGRGAQLGYVRTWMLGGLATLAVAAVVLAPRLHWGAELQPASFDYPSAVPVSCPHHGLETLSEADRKRLPRAVVRTPSNYTPSFPHPLLIVFSPAGLGAGLTERYTGLTQAATGAGAIVAYVGSRRMTAELPAVLSRLPAAIAERWCIDPHRIVLAGHSDGGTLAQVIALLPETRKGQAFPAAIVASAAGIRESDFATLRCPDVLHVLLFHGRRDGHFPGYGESAARGWARCLACKGEPVPDGEGCLRYPGCSGSVELCLHPGSHPTWPTAAGGRIVDLASTAERQ